jgi:hypothetical protein
MRRMETMTAGGVTLAGLGALVGLAIGSNGSTQKLVAQRIPPVEVRTEIIRKTITVYRREHPHHATGPGPGNAPSGPLAQAPAGSAPVATHSSGVHAIAPAASESPVVSTRSSGSKTTSGSGSGRPVSTRSSGGGDGEGNGGGHGD